MKLKIKFYNNKVYLNQNKKKSYIKKKLKNRKAMVKIKLK